MANPEHLEALKRGQDDWIALRSEHKEMRPDLSAADLSYTDLRARLLLRSNLRDAILEGANLTGASLSDADLGGAHLTGSILYGADLRGADLSGADLRGAILYRAMVDGLNLEGARLGWTDLGGLDLRQVRGLETVSHSGPSSIGLDTLHKSIGIISQDFLEGLGVSPHLISSLPSLFGIADEATRFYSCFISHSTGDYEFCNQLRRRMIKEGLLVWFAPEDLQGGHKLDEQLDQAIRRYDKLLLVLSEASMASEWVGREVRLALRREKAEGRRLLFPIGLVPYEKIEAWEDIFDKAIPGKDLTDEVREYFIPDFSNWQDEQAFDTAFSRLLEDLRKSEER